MDEALQNLLRKLEILDRVDDAPSPPMLRAQPDLVVIKDGVRKEYEIRPKYSEEARTKLAEKRIRYQKSLDRVLTEEDLQDRGIFSVVDDWVRKVRDAQDAIIGAAVREANGVCGVRLVRTGMWDIVSCKPDPTIPAGEIWEKVDHNIQTPPYFWKDE